MPETYQTHAKGIRILPGQWRPHYPFEQIGWVSPPWPSQDYVWLDFPEAIFSEAGLLFLSHVSPAHPVMFPGLPKVAWQRTERGMCFERCLPNGVVFGGALRARDGSTVALEIFLRNGSDQPLRNVKLQTCAYLRGIREFADHTMANKYVHVPRKGWAPFEEARRSGASCGQYRLGWRSGPKIADQPVMATVSSRGDRIVAITWYESTYSLTGNPHHPCMHADPFFPDLDPGQRARIDGGLIFFEGSLNEFGEWFVQKGTEARRSHAR